MTISQPKRKWNIKVLRKDGLTNEELIIGQLWECADYFLFSPKMLWDWTRTFVRDTKQDVLDDIKGLYGYRLGHCEGFTGQILFSMSNIDQVF